MKIPFFKTFQIVRIVTWFECLCVNSNNQWSDWTTYWSVFKTKLPFSFCPSYKSQEYLLHSSDSYIISSPQSFDSWLYRSASVCLVAVSLAQVCMLCHRWFSSSGNLRVHMVNVHTPSQRVPCLVCHKAFKNKWYLRKHYVNSHNAPVKPRLRANMYFC